MTVPTLAEMLGQRSPRPQALDEEALRYMSLMERLKRMRAPAPQQNPRPLPAPMIGVRG